ncbi:DUF1517 domain-containing protein [Spirulina sp. CS-785/01]|uniref:DUF1517 domain-containing protein n=1 Tax=Spirulina sp. CS-785/01 TaxID=3021716 RepID=UPI00232BC516|nr:DUF1517 domain-containing protein [Spirulina sp. CS-785/01]MDB9311756.1 DUF1517 domain-containing protein [Spirulina sp. CS-785/01]
MGQKILLKLKPFIKALFLCVLVLVLTLAPSQDALARRGGGRIGGGSFRAPRTYSPPRGGAPRGGTRGPGGGIGFPFLFPFFGIGGGFGGLFTIILVIAIANFLINAFRNSGIGEDDGTPRRSNKVSVAKVQVGLLAEARELQKELTQLGRTADTGTASGRSKVLQEASLALLRNPQYWVYGAAENQQAALESAEARFNQLALEERSKFSSETLSNVDSQIEQSKSDSLPTSELSVQEQMEQDTRQYIIVTLLVGAEGKIELPSINSSDDLKQALQTIAGLGSDRLLALELLWSPQAENETLTSDDIFAEYPHLKLV